jgi:hypothetical protein
MPKVSVIIATYQRAHLVNRAIASVFAQTYDDYEIIVVNDGSTDDTRYVLSDYGDRIIAIHQNNRGLAAARNAGIQVAQGEYIAFLDDDDLWAPQKLEHQIPLFVADQNIGLVYADMTVFNETEILPGTYLNGFVPPHTVMPWTLLQYGNFFPMPTIVIRRICLEEVGYFNEALSVCEDYDLWLRIIEKWAACYVNLPLARYFRDENHPNLSQNTEQMLQTTLQVKLAAFERTPQLQRLPSQYRDLCLYPDYLDLAEFYTQAGNLVQARAILKYYQPTQPSPMPETLPLNLESPSPQPDFTDHTIFCDSRRSQKIVLSHDVLSHPVGRKSILLKLATGRDFNLNETATRILNLLLASASIADAYQQLRQEFPIASEVLQKDMLGLLENLSGRQLIDITPVSQEALLCEY